MTSWPAKSFDVYIAAHDDPNDPNSFPGVLQRKETPTSQYDSGDWEKCSEASVCNQMPATSFQIRKLEIPLQSTEFTCNLPEKEKETSKSTLKRPILSTEKFSFSSSTLEISFRSAEFPPNLLSKRKEAPIINPELQHDPIKSGFYPRYEEFNQLTNEIDEELEIYKLGFDNKERSFPSNKIEDTIVCPELAEDNTKIKTYKRHPDDLIDLHSDNEPNFEEWQIEKTFIQRINPFIRKVEKFDEILYTSIGKDSDESEYEESQQGYDESSPLGFGWKHAICLSSTTNPMAPESIILELFNRENGRFELQVDARFAERLGDTIYMRYRQKDKNFEVYPSCHNQCVISSLKIRPKKSIEMKPIAVVAFCKDKGVPIPVWSDILGWKTIDHRHNHVYRRGLMDTKFEDVFKPLRLIEFLAKVRLDISLKCFSLADSECVKAFDVSPLCVKNPDKEEIPEFYYPKCPRRIDDLQFEKADMMKYCYYFRSPSQPNITFWASIEQCSLTSEDKKKIISGVFVPIKDNAYRGLAVAPIQRLHRMTKGHFLNYKRFPPRQVPPKKKVRKQELNDIYQEFYPRRRWEV